MGKVLWLVERSNRETVRMLGALHAEAEHKEVDDVVVIYRKNGRERFVLTGRYRTNRAEAVKAAVRMKHRLMQAEDEEGPTRW